MSRGSHAATLRAVVETFAPDGADEAAVARTLEAAMERLLPHRRKQLLQFLWLLDGIALVRHRARFGRISRPAREVLCRRLADHPLAALRSGFNAFKRLVLFIAYAHDDEDARNPLWGRIGYPGPRDDVPATTPSLQLAAPQPGRLRADVVVVGSGAGGGVAASLFAAAGYRTVVLEAGPPAEDVAKRQNEAHAVASLYLESGLAATTDLSVSVLAGACVGGGTTVNWSTSLRLSESTLRQWTDAAGVPALALELNRAYDEVERRLDLAVAPGHNRNNAVIARGCERLGWNVVTIPRNASGCGEGCGYCGFGCAYGKKRGTAATYLRDAVACGATIYANVRVDRALTGAGAAIGVEGTISAEAGGGTLRVEAPLVIVAAGALRTPGLLARTGVRSRHLGRHLRLHPVAALSAEFDEPIEPWTGAIQSALCDRLADADGGGYGVVIECAPAHPGLAGLAIPWRSAAQHASEMARFRNAAVLIALVRDRGEGSVSLDGRDDIRYRVTPYDAQHLLEGLLAAATLSFAAGARRVMTFHADPVILERHESRGGLDAFAAAIRSRGFGSNRTILFSAHQMGTARMNADPRHGVVDAYGAVHGIGGLLVVDSSAFPLSSGVNPMLSVMALAHRAASQRIAIERGSTAGTA